MKSYFRWSLISRLVTLNSKKSWGVRIFINCFLSVWQMYVPGNWNRTVITARLVEASEGYVFRGVCHSLCPTRGGGRRWSSTPMARMSTPSPGPGQNVYPLPPPGPGQNVYPLPPPRDHDRMSTPSPPRTRSECLPPPSPPRPGQNVYTPPPPRDLGHADYTQAGGTHPTGMHRWLLKHLFEQMIIHQYRTSSK